MRDLFSLAFPRTLPSFLRSRKFRRKEREKKKDFFYGIRNKKGALQQFFISLRHPPPLSPSYVQQGKRAVSWQEQCLECPAFKCSLASHPLRMQSSGMKKRTRIQCSETKEELRERKKTPAGSRFTESTHGGRGPKYCTCMYGARGGSRRGRRRGTSLP